MRCIRGRARRATQAEERLVLARRNIAMKARVRSCEGLIAGFVGGGSPCFWAGLAAGDLRKFGTQTFTQCESRTQGRWTLTKLSSAGGRYVIEALSCRAPTRWRPPRLPSLAGIFGTLLRSISTRFVVSSPYRNKGATGNAWCGARTVEAPWGFFFRAGGTASGGNHLRSPSLSLPRIRDRSRSELKQ
jgi:hypothetical protein